MALLKALFLLLIFPQLAMGQQLGDPGWSFDNSKYDSRFPTMREWAKAGVQGGIPYRAATPIRKTLQARNQNMSSAIQSAIDEVSRAGGGVVLLKNGTYPIHDQIRMKSNVILRGQNKDKVLLEVFMRDQGPRGSSMKAAFYWKNINKSGLEDFSMILNVDYQGKQMFPLDKDWPADRFLKFSSRNQTFQNERVYHDRKNFKFHTVKNMDIGFVDMEGKNKNCWLDNCNFRDSGTSPIDIGKSSEHITVRNCLIAGAFQKGGGGSGYFNCSGRYVLMVKNTVSGIRHWAIQLGAEYCVAYNNISKVDINFHQADKGKNLVENNKVHIPFWHNWNCFQAGSPSLHKDPGKGNMFFNNDCIQKQDGRVYTDKKVYTFKGKRIDVLDTRPPSGGTLYAMTRKNAGGVNPGKPREVIADGSYHITAPSSGQRLLSRSNEQHSAIMHNTAEFGDQVWIFDRVKDNIYTIKNKGTNRYLEAPRGACSNGADVATWTSAGSDHQKWELVAHSDNTYSLKPLHCSTSALDRSRGAIDANVQLWGYNPSNDNQRWTIITAESSASRKSAMKEGPIMSIYPNPVVDELSISGLEAGDLILIHDLMGVKMKQLSVQEATESISVNDLNSGQYIISISGKAKFQMIKK